MKTTPAQGRSSAGSAPLCACGRPLAAADCCRRFHAGIGAAPDAESLMRSRYVAYVDRLEPYLLATWHPSTRPVALNLAAQPTPEWLGLEIKAAVESGDTATVEFIARCRIGGRALRTQRIGLPTA